MKIIVSDIDEKILDLDNFELLKLINKFTNNGNMFIIATDKAINYVADYFVLSDLNIDYFICNDGAVIFDRYYNVLYRKDLKQEVVLPIVNILKQDENILETFIDTSHGFVSDLTSCANGIVARPYDKDKAEITLNAITLKYPSVKGHVNENWLNITDSSINKAVALKYIQDTYKLNDAEIYVFGKSDNDLCLMEAYNGYNYKDCSDDLKRYSKGEFNELKDLIEYILKEDKQIDEETIYI